MAETKEVKEKIDLSDVENGPVTEANRECRDIFCCLLFLAAIGGMVYLTIYGYMNGNPAAIFRGVDLNGIACGDPKGVAAAFPYIYFVTPAAEISKRYCVVACPSFSGTALTALSCYGATCTYTYQYNSAYTLSPSGAPGSNDIIGYESISVIDRICVPTTVQFTKFAGIYTSSNATVSAFSSAAIQSQLGSFISDIKNNWMWLLAAFGVAILISFIFMFALRCLAGCVVWVSLLGIIFFLGAIGFIFLYNGGVFGADAAATVATYLNVPKLSTSTQTNQVLGGIFLGLAGLFIIVVLCCCSRIRLAVAVCKCAGQFVGGVCLIVLVPLFQTAVALGVWAGCLIIMIYLVSCTKFISSSSNYFTSIGDYGDENLIRFYCFIFGTLWVNAFIGAVGIFVVASACCMWYFSHGPNSELSLPIARSYKMVFRYHFGSLAFGSFILAIVQFLQFLLEMFKKQADNSGINNKCLEYCTNCMRCCLACIERIVQFLNKTAYIQIALRGKNFCAAAKDGFELVWSNAMRYAIVSGVGEIIMFMGKLMIAAATTALYYCFITYVSSVQVNYQQPIYSLILVAIMSYAVAMFFMAVYSLAMDTLLQCFIVDETTQQQKGGKAALYAPYELGYLIDRD